MKKIVILFLALYSALYSASICSSRDFVNRFKNGVSSANYLFKESIIRIDDAYCKGDTFYIIYKVYDKNYFNQISWNLNNNNHSLAKFCTFFDDDLRIFNSQNNSNLRGNFVYVYEYNGQRLQYSCP